METSTAIDDPDMQRLLFSDNPLLLGEMPVFGPPVDLPPFYSEPTQELISSDPSMRVAEAACMADDADRASASVQDLLDTGTDPRDLQICLSRAAQSGHEDLVQMLLSIGVPVSLEAVKVAITKESTRLLAMFLEYGWDINEEEAWCVPPLLSYVRLFGGMMMNRYCFGLMHTLQICYIYECIRVSHCLVPQQRS